MKCTKCNQEIKKPKTLKIKELKIEVTYPVEHTAKYSEISIPAGWRLINVRDLWWILDSSKYLDDFLGNFKGKWNRFWCEQTVIDKRKKQSRWLNLNRDLGLGSLWDYLDDSNSSGRVVFAKNL